ncbi:MAG: NYN domain-containing protein [Candidatus Micrarchaeota archaeon]
MDNNGIPEFKNKLDYLAFSEKLCRTHNSERFRTYVYDALPYQHNPPNAWESAHLAEKQKFKSYLDSLPSFMTRYGICLEIPNKNCYCFKKGTFTTPCKHITQKGVDVRFSIDLVSLATDKRIDKAILITGDSDFIPAINYAREVNMKITLYYLKLGNITLHKGLPFVCDERFQLTKQFFQDCLLPTAP